MKNKSKQNVKSKSRWIGASLSAAWLLSTGDFLKSFFLLFVIVVVSYLFTKEEKGEELVETAGKFGWPAVLVFFFAVLYGTVQISAVQADSRIFSSMLGKPEKSESLFENKEAAAETELMVAASTGDVSSLKRLIKEGTNLDSVNEAGETALHYAAYNRQMETARLLLKAGADPNKEDNGAYTPLGITYSYNNIEMAALFIQYGANADQKDQYGESIRAAAMKAGDERFLQVLKQQ